MNKIVNEFKHFRKNSEISLLALPGIIVLFVFCYIPMLGLGLAFVDYQPRKGILGSPFVWFKNFEFFFVSETAFRVTRNTILLNLMFITISLIVSVAFAIMLFELSKRSVKIFQTAMFVPYFISWVVFSYVVYGFLSEKGVVNNMLALFGKMAVDWYAEPSYWILFLLLMNLWKVIGYLSIIYYTGLLGIDESYYEASTIDGATKFQQIRYISIPLLMPLITLLTLTAISNIIRADFGMFYFVTKDSAQLYPVTDVIDTYVYRARLTDVGMGTAAGLYQSIVGFVLVLVSNFVVRKTNEENAIF